MHDIKQIRQNPAAFDAGLTKRNLAPLSAKILMLDEKLRDNKTTLQNILMRRNSVAKEIGQAKAKGESVDNLLQEAENIKQQTPLFEQTIEELETELQQILVSLPNIPYDEVPNGLDENNNVELRTWGKAKSFESTESKHFELGEQEQINPITGKPNEAPQLRAWGEQTEFAFTPKQHFELGEKLGQMDFETASLMSGARFVVLKADLARLERALANFMLDIHTQEFGYQEISPPLLVRDEAMFGTGQLPNLEEDSFKTREGYRLIPTAEVSLTNLVAQKILEEEVLPLRYTAFTPCFRSEAGSAGRDTRGMFRQHQFSKVELVSITRPQDSANEHERMTACAEEILKRLELPYRVVLLCGGDIGFNAHKTYDLEVWLPAQERYREISSCSNCGDFQARRMKARYKELTSRENRFVHTLNGSALAVGRTIIAILENYQNGDGSITIPKELRPFMRGQSIIKAI